MLLLRRRRILVILIIITMTNPFASLLFGKRTNANGRSSMAKASSSSTTTAAAAAAFSARSSSTSRPSSSSSSIEEVKDRLKGALWGFLAGDALSAPTHWYYGGRHQVMAEYGHLITDYTKPNTKLPGSILNKSNLNGGGRSLGTTTSSSQSQPTIIGDVINHGKQDLWSPHKSIHYHATLQKGENTLEVQIARVLMKSITDNQGKFDANHFRKAYIDFMTTPGSHNDTYASTCHRMFFANLVHRKLPPEQCPDNDFHNVDTVDGLILPTITALAGNPPTAASVCASVTRNSPALEKLSGMWGQVVQAALLESNDDAFLETLAQFSQQTIQRQPNPSVNDDRTLSACYLSQALPGLIDMTAKYTRLHSSSSSSSKSNVWEGLLANANVGGENVHRGSLLGAVLGARAGYKHLPTQLVQGLVPHDELVKEIDAFCEAVLPSLVSGTQAVGECDNTAATPSSTASTT